ncbi:MAG TPA: ABC transporter permease [bacterium]|nr:ABC transporter permease [bacterium]
MGIWRKLSLPGRIGLAVLILFVLMALFAPLISPFDPNRQNLDRRLEGPSLNNLLGRDEFGRDILSRIIYGSRVSLAVGTLVISISLAIGVLVGMIVGYLGGWTDQIVMRVVDIVLAFPGILLAIALMAVLGQSLFNVVLALCITGWAPFARLARGETLSIRERQFVIAARSLGASALRIAWRHILPNISSPILVRATLGMAGVIVAEAALSFLGLGVRPPTPSWGAMLNSGRTYILVTPHLVLFPGIAIMLVVLSLNFLGDGLRDVLDPRRLSQ